MNVVKLLSDLPDNQYSGKWILYINGKYGLPIEESANYWMNERGEVEQPASSFVVVDDMIDWDATNQANSLAKFIYQNEHSIDSEIPLSELKRFRTWLAEQLLMIEGSDSEDGISYELDIKTMLNYYASDTYDDIIKVFNALSPYINTINLSSMLQSTCGCSTNANLTLMNSLVGASNKMSTVDLSNITISSCDVVMMYRRYIYNCMVDTFREISFWEDKTDLVSDMIKYIQGILDHNLPLFESDYLTTFADCDCLANGNYSQISLQEILKRLITALGYIKDGDIKEHKNFISNTLYEWSSRLYEKMIW